MCLSVSQQPQQLVAEWYLLYPSHIFYPYHIPRDLGFLRIPLFILPRQKFKFNSIFPHTFISILCTSLCLHTTTVHAGSDNFIFHANLHNKVQIQLRIRIRVKKIQKNQTDSRISNPTRFSARNIHITTTNLCLLTGVGISQVGIEILV